MMYVERKRQKQKERRKEQEETSVTVAEIAACVGFLERRMKLSAESCLSVKQTAGPTNP